MNVFSAMTQCEFHWFIDSETIAFSGDDIKLEIRAAIYTAKQYIISHQFTQFLNNSHKVFMNFLIM